MNQIINIELMKNPANWVIVISMWMLAALLLHWLSSHFTEIDNS